ncbi:MAG: adenylate kinase [Melioribacteraceae bacterium]|nr:adenylate kinase [Melioribacteraceae bacterium]
MQIILFGAPGVGKGTQAKILSQKYNIKHISTGDILRHAIAERTDLGNAAKEVVERGDLVPDNLIGRLVKETLINMDYKKGFILDGFPRTITQCGLLDRIFEELKIENPYFVILKADTEIVVNRLTNRRLCTECATIVNIKDLDDTQTCPNCGARNTCIKREDDKDSVVRKRLEIYRKTTFPVIDYYKDKYTLAILNGTDPIDVVTQNIIKVLS